MPTTPDPAQMTMMEHLAELRRRLIVGFLAIGVGAIAAWILYPQIIELLLAPYCDTLDAGDECQLYVRNPLEPFSVRLTVAGYGGVINGLRAAIGALRGDPEEVQRQLVGIRARHDAGRPVQPDEATALEATARALRRRRLDASAVEALAATCRRALQSDGST